MEMKIWNRLCEKVNKKLNVSEGRFEKEIALEFLGALNWSEYYDNLKEQFQIDVHGDKWIPDFALFVDGKDDPDIIVELKKPSHKQRSKDRCQITTYMKLVDCRFGLYFGEKLELFYLDYEPEKRVSKSVLSVEFTTNDKNGKRLIDLLKYDSFDRNQLRTFCENQLKLESVCKFWCSDEGRDKLYSYILEQSKLPSLLSNSLRSSLGIDVTQKLNIIEEDQPQNNDSTGCAEGSVINTNEDDFFTFILREPTKGTDAKMFFYPKEQKYVIKAYSKVSAKETKDCSPEAKKLRKIAFSDSGMSRRDGDVYTLLRDFTIVSKTGTPNVAGHFCTGRSTNARVAWVDEKGLSYGEVFPKSTDVNTLLPNIKSDTSASLGESSFLANCINRVSKTVGVKLIRRSGNAYVTADNNDAFVFRTSKIYEQGNREKYWYAYKRMRDIADCKNKYYVFGCSNANTIIILPISEIESQIEGLNYSQDANGNPLYWHIVFFKEKNGKMTWLISKPAIHEVDISDKLL